MHAAFEDGQIVGGAGAFPFELSVPGGSLPCAGVTAVGVHPTHRRRGVLRSMMDTQLRDVHERGEPIAALWASEETIYGRFGYGIASLGGRAEGAARVGRVRRAARARRDGAVRHARRGARAVPARVRGRAARAARDDVEERRVVGGASPAPGGGRERRAAPLRRARARRRAAGATRSTGRTSASTAAPRARGSSVREALGATPQATAAIWRFLLDVDWMATVEVFLAAAGPSALPAPRRAAPDALPDGRRPLGAARRPPRRAVGPRVRRRRAARARGARRGLRMERRALAARRRRRASAPTRNPISRSTSPLSAPPTSAPSRSRSCATGSAWRSCGREPPHARTRSSRGARCRGAPRSSDSFEQFSFGLRSVHLNG